MSLSALQCVQASMRMRACMRVCVFSLWSCGCISNRVLLSARESACVCVRVCCVRVRVCMCACVRVITELERLCFSPCSK